jgi:hypothetical protein
MTATETKGLSALAKRRLLKLAERLRTVPNKEFNINHWKKSNCQTTACAVVWHALFHRLGKQG